MYILRYPKWVNNYVPMIMMTTLNMNIPSRQKLEKINEVSMVL